ncbi:lactate utilization protein B/C [Boudabousia tangfeifanii]|uniref:Lactate utilization protein B/C n=1 Tax=Boudabousia tangfeifanii TaxID=1912795 RepID=A0A1D9MJ14_9ACTO|nr:lactate utilization protein C [Boudabousia tangfeifanii]AOZ72272.1 lactate utilization protein B/C [Boudabousia tangfeifanii]
MDARTEILNNVRQALAVSQKAPAPEPPREYRQETEHAVGSQPVIDELVDALIDYTAEVTVVDEAGIEEAISNFLMLDEAKRVVVPAGLPETWKKAAGNDGREVVVDDPASPLTNHELDKIQAVVTGARLGISLSGTIVLDGQSDQGRRAITLVPDTHVCVLYAKDVYPTVPQAVKVLEAHPTRPLTWFAGPSATSDIELVRVDGVHGPRNLRVIIVK